MSLTYGIDSGIYWIGVEKGSTVCCRQCFLWVHSGYNLVTDFTSKGVHGGSKKGWQFQLGTASKLFLLWVAYWPGMPLQTSISSNVSADLRWGLVLGLYMEIRWIILWGREHVYNSELSWEIALIRLAWPYVLNDAFIPLLWIPVMRYLQCGTAVPRSSHVPANRQVQP